LPSVSIPKGHGLSLGNTPTYHRNLDALRSRQPRVAEWVDASALPDGAALAVGRDETQTAVHTLDGRTAWLGQSSMPRVTTEVQLEGALFEPGSIWVPGILAGLEPLELLHRLAAPFAVFVIERRPELLKLALQIHDYTEGIGCGRLLFFPEDDLEQAADAFFAANPGYEMPPHLLTVWQRSPTDIGMLRRRLEGVAMHVATGRSARIAAIVRSIEPFETHDIESAPRFAIVTVEGSPDTLGLGGRLAAAVAHLGWTAACCLPDAPERCHITAQLRAIADARANIVLCLGAGSGTLREMLPDGLPVVCWHLSAAAPRNVSPALGPSDIVLAGSPWIKQQLLAGGAPTDRMAICPPGATIDMAQPPRTPSREAAQGIRAALFADCPDDRAESCGITLTSHTRLWGALRRIARTTAAKGRSPDVKLLMELAQKESAVRISDDGITSHLCELATSRIMPVAETLAVAHTIAAWGVRVEMYGSRLDEIVTERTAYCGAIPSLTDMADVLTRVDLLVAPLPDIRTAQWAVDAVAAGSVAICRTSPFGDSQGDDLPDFPPCPILWYGHLGELADILNGFVDDADAFRAAAVEATAFVRRSHRLADRVRSIHEFVVRAVGAPRHDAQVACRTNH